jgi:hypothetical protein
MRIAVAEPEHDFGAGAAPPQRGPALTATLVFRADARAPESIVDQGAVSPVEVDDENDYLRVALTEPPAAADAASVDTGEQGGLAEFRR